MSIKKAKYFPIPHNFIYIYYLTIYFFSKILKLEYRIILYFSIINANKSFITYFSLY